MIALIKSQETKTINLSGKNVLCRSDNEALKVLKIAENQNYKQMSEVKPTTYWPDMYPAMLYFDKDGIGYITFDYVADEYIDNHTDYIAATKLLKEEEKQE